MKTKCLVFIYICCLLNLSVSLSFTQTADQYSKINIITKDLGNLEQKLYLHFDKENYKAGEHIWFKAYLLGSQKHKLDTAKTNLYVDLYNCFGDRIKSSVFRLHNGISNGDFYIDSTIADGNYFIKAYTDCIIKKGQDNLFYKYFYISNNGYQNIIYPDEIKQNKSFNKELAKAREDLKVVISPSAFTLPSTRSYVIRVSDGLGRGVACKGFVKESNQKIIREFNTDELGLAAFEITYSQPEKYLVEVVMAGGKRITNQLPETKLDDPGCSVSLMSDTLSVEVINPKNQPLKLKIRSRGNVLFEREIGRVAKLGVKVSRKNLVTGINTIELIDDKNNILLTRPQYINNDDQVFVHFKPSVIKGASGNFLKCDFQSVDYNGQPVTGIFSAAVTTGSIGKGGDRESIYSNLLCSSEMDVDQLISDEYFIEGTQKFQALNDLLLTSGIHNSAAGSSSKGYISRDDCNNSYGATFSGYTIDPSSNQPISSVFVGLDIEGYQKEFKTKANEKGFFIFRNLDINDSARVIITASHAAGGVRPLIQKVEPEEIQEDYKMNWVTQDQRIIQKGENWVKRRRPRNYDESVYNSPYGDPDQTIQIDQRVVYRNLLEVLQEKAIGLIITSGSIMFRGPSSFMYSSQPLYIKDHIVVSEGEFLDQDPREISRIELFKGASTASFGSRGTNGVIISYSKRSSRVVKDNAEYVVKGFTTPHAFTSNLEFPNKEERYTLVWEPNLIFDASGRASLLIPLQKNKSFYRVIIEGIGNDGGIAYGDYIFEK